MWLWAGIGPWSLTTTTGAAWMQSSHQDAEEQALEDIRFATSLRQTPGKVLAALSYPFGYDSRHAPTATETGELATWTTVVWVLWRMTCL